jgi:hypothetical protein
MCGTVSEFITVSVPVPVPTYDKQQTKIFFFVVKNLAFLMLIVSSILAQKLVSLIFCDSISLRFRSH